jgi:hypothetical protein
MLYNIRNAWHDFDYNIFHLVPWNAVLQNKIRIVAYITGIAFDIKSVTEINIGVFKTNVGKNKSDIRFMFPSLQSNIKIWYQAPTTMQCN